ncbi:MAG: ribosome silencing factor [Bacteroidales bacterium]|nr:ribosome silencing factor [Bacteroidales bacterium]
MSTSEGSVTATEKKIPATRKKAVVSAEKKEKVATATKKKLVVTAEKKEVKVPVAKKTAVVSAEKKEPVTSKKVGSPKKNMLDETEIKCIADAILDKKGSFVCSLDLRPIGTAICDYFVVCNADSSTQVNAIADNIEEMMIKNCGRKVIRKQGKENAFWVILDYANIVVHVFQTEYRQFYRLEDLWADAKRTVYQE